MSSNTNTPRYKFTYFDCRGFGEPARFLFHYQGVPFIDQRIPEDDGYKIWNKLKKEIQWGVLPLLEVEDKDGTFKQLAQSAQIFRYLGNQFGLGGVTEWDQAKIGEYVDAIIDVRNSTLKSYVETDPLKKAGIDKDLRENILPKAWERFNSILKKNGGGYLVGDKLSYGDIVVGYYVDYLDSLYGGGLDKYPELVELKNMVHNLPGIKEWVEKRPKTEF